MPISEQHLQMAILKYLQTTAEATEDEDRKESLQVPPSRVPMTLLATPSNNGLHSVLCRSPLSA